MDLLITLLLFFIVLAVMAESESRRNDKKDQKRIKSLIKEYYNKIVNINKNK